jgi:hypothetical protein
MSVVIGALGRALTALAPNGTVEIEGESHSARSVRKLIPAESCIVVVGRDNHGLIVREAADVDASALPGAGTVAQSPSERQQTNEERGRAEDWDSSVKLIFFLVLISIFPLFGFFSYGMTGIAYGLIADVALGFLYAGMIGF